MVASIEILKKNESMTKLSQTTYLSYTHALYFFSQETTFVTYFTDCKFCNIRTTLNGLVRRHRALNLHITFGHSKNMRTKFLYIVDNHHMQAPFLLWYYQMRSLTSFAHYHSSSRLTCCWYNTTINAFLSIGSPR